MGTVTNNYAVVTVCFAAKSLSLANTTAARLGAQGLRYLARRCTAQPVTPAIVSARTKRTSQLFKIWSGCQKMGGFNLKRQLAKVHAGYAPGIAAARRKVSPSARLLSDYFYYKAARKTLPRLRNAVGIRLTLMCLISTNLRALRLDQAGLVFRLVG